MISTHCEAGEHDVCGLDGCECECDRCDDARFVTAMHAVAARAFTEAAMEAGYRSLAEQDTAEDHAIRRVMRDRARLLFTNDQE